MSSEKININRLTIILTVIELLNIIFSDGVLNLIITIPEVIFIIVLLINKKLKKAIYYHLIFTILCFNTDYGGTSAEYLLSYAKIKLVGPITLSYALCIIIWILTFAKFPHIKHKNTLFYKFRMIILYLMISGVIIGIPNVLSNFNVLEYFIRPFVYTFISFIILDILNRLYSVQFISRFYITALCLLVASPIATSLSFFVFNIKGQYSVFDALITNEIYSFVPCLIIILLLGTKHKKLVLLGVGCYFLNLMVAARGFFYMTTAIALIVCAYIIYFTKGSIKPKLQKFLKIAFPVCLFFTFTYLLMKFGNTNTLSSQKFNQFIAIATFAFNGGISIENIPSSPYIRIGETIDIIYEGIHNPLSFIIGKGFGGYYKDILGLFDMLDLTQGAFSEEIVASGKLRTAHSMLPSTLLYNGIIGVILLFRLGVAYVKKITISPYAYVAICIFFYSFYYNPLLIIAAIFLLYGAEYNFIKGRY